MKEYEAQDRSFASLKVGDTVSREHSIDAKLIDAFAALSGDRNPLHVDAVYSSGTPYKAPIAHGMLLGAFVSELVGMHLPGKRSLLLKETLEFKKPVYAGDTITIRGTITSKSEATQLVELAITIQNGKEIVGDGSAHIKILPVY